jgi:putative FmdB family regulatory protein
MPHYDYSCDNCGLHQKDVYQSIKDKAYKICPECNNNSYKRLISGGLDVFVSREPSTIGQIADRNSKKNKTKLSELQAKKKESEPQKEDKSYIRKINKMTPTQRKKWIMEGD